VVRGVCDAQRCVARCVVSYYIINTRATSTIISETTFSIAGLLQSVIHLAVVVLEDCSVPYGESGGPSIIYNTQGISLTVIIHNTGFDNFTARFFGEFNESRVAPFPFDFCKAPYL
jgi:hypothetical protein